MRELQLKQFPVNYSFNWEYGVTIEEIREDLDAMEKLGATHVDIDKFEQYDSLYITMKALAERLETEDEMWARVNKIQNEAMAVERNEKARLKELKEKYE